LIKKAPSPLLKTRVYDSLTKMPIKSTRIAAQPLTKVPVAKRGEALVIQRLARTRETTVEEARADYGSMFGDDPPDSESDALRELFPDCDLGTRGADDARWCRSWRGMTSMDSTTILCWNALGLNAGAQCDNMRTFVQEERPHIACIVESKLNIVTLMDISLLLGMNYVDYAFLR
jgi:hypothetical protein